MFYGLANLGQMETEGYDVGVRYKLPETSFGNFSVDWQNTYTSRYDQAGENADGDPITVGYVGTPGIFRLRSNLGVDWEMGNFGASYTARYYSGMNESCVTNRPCTDPDRYSNGEPAAQRGARLADQVGDVALAPGGAFQADRRRTAGRPSSRSAPATRAREPAGSS